RVLPIAELRVSPSLVRRYAPCIQSGCVSMFQPISPSIMSTITAVMIHITRISDFSLFRSFLPGIYFSCTCRRLSVLNTTLQESSRLCLRQPYSADRFARHCAVGKGATNSHLSGRKVLCTSSQATAPAMPVTTTFLGEPWRESVAVRASDLAARLQVHPISKSLPRSHGGMTTSLRGGPSRHGSRP